MSKRARPNERTGAPPKKQNKATNDLLAKVLLGRRKNPAASERKWAALLSVGSAEDAPGAGEGGANREKAEEEAPGAAASSAAGAARADFSVSAIVASEKPDGVLTSATPPSAPERGAVESTPRPWWNNVELYRPAGYDVFNKINCVPKSLDALWVVVTPRGVFDKERDVPELPANLSGYWRGTDTRLEIVNDRYVIDGEPVFASPDLENVAARGVSGQWELRDFKWQNWSVPTYIVRESLCKRLHILETELRSYMTFGSLVVVDDVLFAPNRVDKMACVDFYLQPLIGGSLKYKARLVRVHVSAYSVLDEVASQTGLQYFWMPQLVGQNETVHQTAIAGKVIDVITQITQGAPTVYHRNSMILSWYHLAHASKIIETGIENIKKRKEAIQSEL